MTQIYFYASSTQKHHILSTDILNTDILSTDVLSTDVLSTDFLYTDDNYQHQIRTNKQSLLRYKIDCTIVSSNSLQAYIYICIQTSQPPYTMNLDQIFDTKPDASQSANQMGKNSLNKYKKKVQKKDQSKNYSKDSNERTSKNQFQKYFLDANNVFFEDRQTLRQIQNIKVKLSILIPIWFIITFLYYFVNHIQPFQGICPQNATCKVFIRCNPGYELSEDNKHCHVKKSIIDHIQNVCKFQIEKLRLQYGDADCQKNNSFKDDTPVKSFEQIFQTLTNTLDDKLGQEIRKKMIQFLINQTNQAQYHFLFSEDKVIPLQRKHSFSCWLQITSQTLEFKIIIATSILVIVLLIWMLQIYKKEKKIKTIYEYLKQKVISEDKVNVTLLGDQIKSIYGNLSEDMWIKIDDERKSDGKIGYYEDQFLYWKLI